MTVRWDARRSGEAVVISCDIGSIYTVFLVEDPDALRCRGKILRVRATSAKVARRFAALAFPQLTVTSLKKEVA